MEAYMDVNISNQLIIVCIGNHTECGKKKRKKYMFEFNLELMCVSEFSKKLKLHKSLWQVQFRLFEKLISAN